jgi:Flp pilus assembly protein TadB
LSDPDEEEEQEQVVPARTRRAPRTPALPRTAKQIIDQAIEDNKVSEYVLYAFATTFVLCGMIALIAGVVRNQGLVAFAGGIGSALFFPAMHQARRIRRENIAIRLLESPLSMAETMHQARRIRRENIAIRLLESPLSMAETSHEAAGALKEFFVDTFISRRANP